MKRLLCLTFCFLLCVGVVNGKIVYMKEWDIYVCEDDGTKVHALTKNKNTDATDDYPRWSPDGTQIVFQRYMVWGSQKTAELFIMDANGTNLQRLTNNDVLDSYPSWSPDGTRIAFDRTVIRDGSKRSEVHVMDLATRTVTQLTGVDEKGIDENYRGSVVPDWSPDGTQIVFERFIRSGFGFSHKILYVMSANGEQQRPLFPIPPADADKATMMFEPEWSADGQRILFIDCTDQGLEKGGQTCQLTVLQVGGKTEVIEDIYDKLGNNLLIRGYCWIENDRAILFSVRNMDDPNDKYDLYRYVFGKRNLKRITKDPRHEAAPDWIEGTLSVSPNGKLPTQWGEKKQTLFR